MRTTLTVDDDLAAALHQLQRSSNSSWKQVVNDVLRAGIASLDKGERARRRVQRTKSVRLGAPLVGDIANVHEILSVVEGEARR
jgi:hypothetical protein